jgi:hypothetical protein
MGEPATSILVGDQLQRSGNGLLERSTCTSTNLPQKRLQFGECLFDGREIGRIRRQEEQTASSGFNGLLHPGPQVDREIIQDHDLPRVQTGSQDLLDVDLKGHAICRSVQDKGRSHALQAHGGDQGHVGSIIAGNLPDRTLSSGSVGIQGGHGNMRTRLIHKDQILASQMQGLLTPRCSLFFFLFAGSQRLFFRVQPRAILAREMLAGLTLTPVFSSHRRQCSSRLTSG